MRQPLELKFRRGDQGGEVLVSPDMEDFYLRWRKGKLLLLIHGFNNPVPEAKKAYEGFIAQQEALANHAPGGDFAPDLDVVEVLWKGDDWGCLSALYYMEAIPNAERTAVALADVLRKLALLRGSIEVEVVAHSLGTRLALELLKALRPEDSVRVTRLVFFAAATPTFMLESPGQDQGLRRAYEQILREGARSLFSGADSVLSLTFPIGQTLAARGEGFFPTALGHECWESLARPASLSQAANPGAGHSDYWGWKHDKPNCEQRANLEAREFLGFTGLGDRVVPSVETARREVESRPDVAAHATSDRETASRAV